MSDSSPQQGASFYDRLWADQWRAVSDHSPLRAARERLMLAEISAVLHPGTTLLDVGSGDGHFLSVVRSRCPGVVIQGVDFSEAARSHAPSDLQPFIAVGDVEDLATVLPGRRYDVVVCSEVLEHVEHPERVLRGIHSLLAPNGLAVLTLPGGQRYWSALDESAGHRKRFEHDEVPALVAACGLRVLKHYGWGATLGRAYYRLIRALGPSQAAAGAQSPLGALAGRVIGALLRVDDLLPTPRGFQLVTVIAHG